ncbi:HAMP domain-containing protein [Candidatus Peregrinibacteria bacterium]|nr:HAMP domain-containing protein [Candidatus Peregrinibacteria bacterium]
MKSFFNSIKIKLLLILLVFGLVPFVLFSALALWTFYLYPEAMGLAVYVRFGFFVILVILSIILAALVLSRKTTEPLQEMIDVFTAVREGDLNARVKIATKDELGEVARTFNGMADRLKKLYASLERRVQQKTRALRDKVLKIQQEKAKDEAILKSIGEGIIVTDNQGNIVLSNRVAQEILGWGGQVFSGKPLSSAMTLQDENGVPIPRDKDLFQLVLARLQSVSGTYYYSLPDRPLFPLIVLASPVILNRKMTGVTMVFRDVTKEKEVERMKNEFVSLVSHQLRTPLSAMKWFSEILLAGDVGHLNSEQNEFIGNIAQLNERMIDLVNALLNISRIDSGRIIIDPVPTNLPQLIQEVLTSLQKKIAMKHLQLTVRIKESLPLIKIDPKLIREVYSNLLSNAVKYTPNGGEISVFISEKEGSIVSQVTDTGYGIPPQEQRKIFQKFYRGSNVVSVETDGNGLGLYLVKSIVESSGGAIWFKSKLGEGSSFWFSLPKKGSKSKKGDVSLSS